MATLKLIHALCALLSISGFVARGILIALDSPIMTRKWIKIAPHTVDTVLLGTAIAMVVGLGVSPWATPWILAKIVALLVYIGLGFVVMRFGKTKPVRMGAWVMAILVFGYIAGVAVTKNSLLF